MVKYDGKNSLKRKEIKKKWGNQRKKKEIKLESKNFFKKLTSIES